ncbi:response regulator [Ohessyouella blattaphilus]|uniref:response regulator n=1 Tax=Ohessyouella blattaphilus TaxID=2949333 RepID=UPI003EBA8996
MSNREIEKQLSAIHISDELKSFFRKVDIQIMISDLDTDVILYANEKMNRAYGVNYDPTGMRCWEAYQIDQVGRCSDCPLNRIRKDEGETIEWERMNPTKERWFRNTSSLVQIGNGRFVHFEQGTDITETKEANQAQYESEAYAQIMLDSTPLICSIWDEEGKMIDCNIAALDYFGVQKKSEYVERFLELNPEYQPNGILTTKLAKSYIDNTLQTGYQRFFWQYQTQKGEPLPVETTLIRVPWHDEYRILAYSQDLREIKEAEAIVERYTSLLRSANAVAAELLASTVQNFQTTITKQMEALAEALNADRVTIWENFTRDEGNTFFYRNLFWWGKDNLKTKRNESLGRELLFDALPSMKASLITNQVYNCLVQDMPLDERVFFASKGIKAVLMLPLVIQEKFWGFISFENCLSEESASDIEISVLKSCSNMLASAIIQNQTNQKLAIATEEALANVRAKDEFMARMSHELRTPMNAVINMTEMAKKADDIESVKELLEMSSTSAKELLLMLNDILYMSNINMNEFVVQKQAYDLEEMVGAVSAVYREKAERKFQTFQYKSTCAHGRVIIGDQEKTERILENLLSNAVKFTPEGGQIQLLISEHIQEGNGAFLRIEAIDNGIGMDENFVAHAFDLFEQESGGRNRSYSGIGLGLTLTKKLVEIMAGTVTIESKQGEGSRFVVELPVTYEKKQAEKKEAPKWPDKTVLLVEDMVINQIVAKALLEDTHVKVECAENGQKAVEMFQANPEQYDLILMDMQMPIMDGVEAARRIRSLDLSRAKDISIYAVTANSYQDDVEACLQVGMNGHISKPIDADVLYQTMQKAFTRGRDE